MQALDDNSKGFLYKEKNERIYIHMAFLDLVLLAAIAGFLGYRLWAVLGTHDAEKPIRKRKSTEDDLVVPIRAKATPTATEENGQETEDAKDSKEEQFLHGATVAFYSIVEAYATGDIETLRNLLAGPLLETFEEAVHKRERTKKTLQVDIARVVTAEIVDDREEKGIAYVTVKFVSEQCLVTRNSRGKILEGDPDQYITVTDIWTFSHPLKSTNPNWTLVATQVEEA
jgi:predicted lipid-binding transport protein (Tim44 family)